MSEHDWGTQVTGAMLYQCDVQSLSFSGSPEQTEKPHLTRDIPS